MSPGRPGVLRARDDYKNQQFVKDQLLGGDWPQRNVFAATKGSDIYFDVHQGDTLEIRIDNKIRSVKIGGIVEVEPIGSRSVKARESGIMLYRISSDLSSQ